MASPDRAPPLSAEALPAGGARVWALTGARRGDNNQVLALARALDVPFVEKPLRYTALHWLPNAWLDATLRTLTPPSRLALEGDPPDLVISVGRRAAPVARAIRARSGGRTRLVHIGHPRLAARHFDLVLTTPQYPLGDAANVLRLPIALGPRPARTPPGEEAARFLDPLPHPRRLLLLGGATLYWRLDERDVRAGIAALLGQCDRDGGSLILLGSPRTPPALIESARVMIGGRADAVMAPLGGRPSYAELLGDADRLLVTADSVSMVSEALMTGKPLGLVPVRPTIGGRIAMALMRRLRPRDLRAFWAELERRGLAGTVDRPSAGGGAPDVLGQAVAAVRRLLAR